MGRRLGKQDERLAERVELELLVDPIADDVAAAGITGEIERPLARGPDHR